MGLGTKAGSSVGDYVRVHAITRDKGGCAFYRLRTPLAALKAKGHDTSVATGVQFDSDRLDRDSVIVGQLLNGPDDLDFWRWLAALPDRPLLVYEVDDDLFTMDGVVTAEVTKGKPLIWAQEATQARVKEFMATADLVTVSTPRLAELYAPHARRVAVLPNAVPDWLLDQPITRPDVFTVGWTLSYSHLLDARHHAGVLDKFMRHCKRARFAWFGSYPSDSPWKDRETHTPWAGNANEYLINLAGRVSVGIAPLGPYTFNAGKSGIKAQEYGALGIPTVASAWPQYRAVIEHGETGFLARTTSDFYTYLTRLYRDPDMVEHMGKRARLLEATRTASMVCDRWIDAYAGAHNERH